MEFTFTDLNNLSDRNIQKLLMNIDIKDLLLSLYGDDKDLEVLKERFMNNLSKRAEMIFKEDMSLLKDVDLASVEEARDRIILKFIQLESSGGIVL